MYHKDFIIGLEDQMEDCAMENEVLEKIISALDKDKDKRQHYLYALSEQKMRHNKETIALMNEILNDIYDVNVGVN